MSKIIHFIVVIAVLVISAGAARAELYGLANEEITQMSETNTPRRIVIGESSLYLIDPDTGDATLIGPTGFFFCNSLDFHPITNVLYAGCFNDIEAAGTEQVLVTIDLQTGKGTEVGPFNANGSLQDFSFDGHGTLFAYFRCQSPATFSRLSISIPEKRVRLVHRGFSGKVTESGSISLMSCFLRKPT